ncbi:glycosyltransferase family 1 protein [Leptospira fletcheri]|uniref:Glycosyltransferase family 1 protein n=1 Tax=Leptospira fletcheri TaxID=2484981 RepID=A0A4R9GF82_9LEPT|nr:glycosyltransferase family 1 protein [Leptospira fletcheri]TGK09940.1 glycosyltransferase family 1 protein [Leptospira fletcheri]
MKVLYDHQIFSIQAHGGISRYFSELIKSFKEDSSLGVQTELSLRVSANEYIRSVWNPRFEDRFFPHRQHFPGKRKLTRIANLPNTLIELFLNRFDIFHPTYYFPYFLPFLGKKPFVLTVYDLIHEKFPQDFAGDRTSEYKPILIEKADQIIAISECTRKDLLKIYDVPEEKVQTVHLAIEPKVGNFKNSNIELPSGDFILFVGGRGTYKNFKFLLKYLPEFFRSYPEAFLFCAGGGEFDSEERLLIEEAGLGGKVLRRTVTDDQLVYLYSKARIFVFPSLYEGFGLPVLESMAYGCLPVLADRSSLPEVAADAAIYFDPESGNSLLSAMERAWVDEGTRKRILKSGESRWKDFSLRKTAKETVEVYRKIGK